MEVRHGRLIGWSPALVVSWLLPIRPHYRGEVGSSAGEDGRGRGRGGGEVAGGGCGGERRVGGVCMSR